MNTSELLCLTFLGGASGVGKTTLVEGLPGTPVVNTGSLFKERMQIASPDQIRALDWSQYEDQVAEDLREFVVRSFASTTAVVIDTHFAAKIQGREYRIGLQRPLLFAFWTSMLETAHTLGRRLCAHVVLVTCDVHALLRRRRLDTARDREIVPSDCYNGLRENVAFVKDYLQEGYRAQRDHDSGHAIRYFALENKDKTECARTLASIVLGCPSHV